VVDPPPDPRFLKDEADGLFVVVVPVVEEIETALKLHDVARRIKEVRQLRVE